MARLVDFHSHFFSRTFFETLAEQSPLPGSIDQRMQRVARVAGIDLPENDERHLARWLTEMESYGVGHMLTLASVPQERPVVAAAVRASGGRLSGLLVHDPTQPEAVDRLADALSADRFRGVLLFPAMHGYRPDAREVAPSLAVLGEHRGIALVHCGALRIPLRDRFGLPRRYDLALANPLHLVPAADANPLVRFVVPHFGAGFFRETLLAGAQCENIHVDTSSANGWIKTQPERLTLVDVFERALGVFGPRRILFGTDSSVFPRGWRHDLLLSQREALGACGLSGADRQRILGGNAGELLGLEA